MDITHDDVPPTLSILKLLDTHETTLGEAINYISWCGANFTERGIDHPQQQLLDKLTHLNKQLSNIKRYVDMGKSSTELLVDMLSDLPEGGEVDYLNFTCFFQKDGREHNFTFIETNMEAAEAYVVKQGYKLEDVRIEQK
jgi:hypothetical protein